MYNRCGRERQGGEVLKRNALQLVLKEMRFGARRARRRPVPDSFCLKSVGYEPKKTPDACSRPLLLNVSLR